jgi:hypothetical protein
MTMDGETYDAEILAGVGISGAIEFYDDGTFDISIGEPLNGMWKNSVLSYIDGDGDSVTNDYTIDKDTLTIDMYDGDNAVFGRSDKSAAPGGANGAETGELSDLQRQWNGTWYGFMTVLDGTGKYEDGVPDTDMYMVVDIDAEGNGTFTVYDYELDLWGSGTCAARAEVLAVIGGTLEYSSEPMVPLDWTFFVDKDFDNRIVNTTGFIDYTGDTFDSCLFFKPWGADWQKEINSGRAGTYPPGYEDYTKMVNNDEPSPFDGGNPATGNNSSGGNTPAPGGNDGNGGTQPPGGDGKTKLNYAELLEIQPSFNLESMTGNAYTYAQVIETLGGTEGHLQKTSMENRWKYFWYATDGGKLEVIFNAETGLYYTSNMYDSSWD